MHQTFMNVMKQLILHTWELWENGNYYYIHGVLIISGVTFHSDIIRLKGCIIFTCDSTYERNIIFTCASTYEKKTRNLHN
jgi:hypothetical protein